MPLFSITSLSQFKITYFIKADTAEEALDEVTMNPELVEASQEHLGERVLGITKLNRKKFDKWLADEMADPSGYVQTWLGERLINVVPSMEVEPGKEVFKNLGTSLVMGTPDVEELFDDCGPYTLPADPYGY